MAINDMEENLNMIKQQRNIASPRHESHNVSTKRRRQYKPGSIFSQLVTARQRKMSYESLALSSARLSS